MESSDSQFSKASMPMYVRPEGRSVASRALQPQKEKFPMERSPLGRVTLSSDSHL